MTIKDLLFYTFLPSLALASCDDASDNNLSSKEASRITQNYQVTYYDSMQKQISLKGKLSEEYEFPENPTNNYIILKNGAKLDYYTKDSKKPGHMITDNAKIQEGKGIYEAKGNVILINPDGDSLKTNALYWNKNIGKIYTTDTVKIIRADNITTNISANGIESDENFKNYKLLKNSGTFPAKDLQN